MQIADAFKFFVKENSMLKLLKNPPLHSKSKWNIRYY